MTESAELARLVLLDEVAANGESFFPGWVFAEAAAAGWRGVVSFSDPMPRPVAGRVLFPGHYGADYQASNAVYTGLGTARTLTVLPDGQVLADRAAQKVRAGERGHGHVEDRLVALGASPRRGRTSGAAWLSDALGQVGAVKLRHPSNHRYAFALGPTRAARRSVRIGSGPLPYPKPAGLAATG
jgi:hypothetical protein